MKLFLLVTLAIGLVAAATPEPQAGRAHKKCHRPKKSIDKTPMAAARVPGQAPSSYRTGLGKTSQKRDKTSLKKLPANLIDPDSPDAPLRTLRYLKRQVTAQDFYECRSSNPAPADSDCNTVIDQVYAASQDLIVSANSCLLFEFNTCWGFFCSLCEQLSTSTDFIGNQLSSVESLCVANGQAGTIVGEDEPQFDVGFIYQGDSLPSYDVC